MRALVTGATGFIGRQLVARLTRPVVLSRDAARARQSLGNVEAFDWDPVMGAPPAEALRDIQCVFHLAGDPVAQGRWTAAKKARVRESRVAGTANLVSALRAMQSRPEVLISASAVGYYGSRGDELLVETSSAGRDYLAEVCAAWEAAARGAIDLGVRVVTARIGIVLGKGGGALAKMLTPFRLGLGGRLGSGQQWMPWVHVDDTVGLLLHVAENPGISGAVNVVAPHPATNAEFTRTLAHQLRRPALLPMPAAALRLAFGEFAEVLLASQRVQSTVAQQSGYAFRYPELSAALAAAL